MSSTPGFGWRILRCRGLVTGFVYPGPPTSVSPETVFYLFGRNVRTARPPWSRIGVFGSERPEARVPSFLGQGIDLTSKTMTKVEDVAYGRLAQVIEGGGKRRIFAIGNYLSQRLLHPFWVMDVLRTIPMDGTFNQDKPLLRLVPAFQCFSYD